MELAAEQMVLEQMVERRIAELAVGIIALPAVGNAVRKAHLSSLAAA